MLQEPCLTGSCCFLVPEEEIRAAEEKFEESKETCYNSMLNLIETADVSLQLLSLTFST